MAFTKSQSDEIFALLDACGQQFHVPVHTKCPLNLGWRIIGQSVILVDFDLERSNPPFYASNAIAKATWVEKKKEWHIFWKRPSGYWQRYEPLREVMNLLRFIIEVEKDPYGLFWACINSLDQ